MWDGQEEVSDIFRLLVNYADTEERFRAISKREPYCPYFLRPIIKLNETCRLSAIIWKISCAVGSIDRWVYIPRSSTKTTVALYANASKNLYLLLPKRSDLDIGEGFVKIGRKALFLTKSDTLWKVEVVWNLKAISDKRKLLSFMETRKVEHKLMATISEKEEVFARLLWDFTKPKAATGFRSECQVRSTFYEYWPMYLRFMLCKYLGDKVDPVTGKKDPAIPVILLNCAKIVQKLHDKKIAHGDIKLDNFLINHKLECRLCDPDSVVFIGNSTKMPTTAGARTYSPDYLSFKALQAKIQKVPSTIDPLKEDIYALGCMFYNLFTSSELPWERCDPTVWGIEHVALLRNKLKPHIEDAKHKLVSGAKNITECLIYWMLEPEQDKRPTIKDVISWLEMESTLDDMDGIEIA